MNLQALTAKMNNRLCIRLLTLEEAEKLWEESNAPHCALGTANVEVFYQDGNYRNIAYGLRPRQWSANSLFATRELDHIDKDGTIHYKMRSSIDNFNILEYLEAQ